MTSERRTSTKSEESTTLSEVSEEIPKKKRVCNTVMKYALAWIVYVLVGSWIFLVLERKHLEFEVVNEKWTRYKELASMGDVVKELYELEKHLNLLCPHAAFNSSSMELPPVLNSRDPLAGSSKSRNLSVAWISEVEIVCGSSFKIIEHTIEHSTYSFVDAIYYTMTLVTTIGFGYVYPTTIIGRLFCIPYALIGVPLTCILMAKTSEMLSNRMLKFYDSTKKRYSRHPKLLLGAVTWMFLILGCFVFMFLPSMVFALLEEWSHVDAFYFTFITLSTIGFGDLVAGYGGNNRSDTYKILIVVWIMIALGYWIFLLNFLQKAIKSNAKTLKKTFRGKNITKQMEFLKQLMTKVKQQQEEDLDEDDADYGDRLHAMALIVESLSGSVSDIKINKSLSSLHSNHNGHSRLSVAKSIVSEMASSHDPDERTLHMEDNRPELLHRQNSLITFKDLLRVKVSLKTETVPGFHSLLEQSVSRENTLGGRQDTHKGSVTSLKGFKEVTLPLKDVLSLVLFAASVDDELSELSGSSSPGAVIDPSESVPLLKSILVKEPRGAAKAPNGFNDLDKERIQNSYLESALSSYLDDCDDHLQSSVEKEKQAKKSLV